jgi:O-antigen/teichoic acid export membrane protein
VLLLLLTVVVTPVLLHRLGVVQYGIWILVHSVAGALAVANLGLGDATVKFVSSYRARGDDTSVNAVIRSTLTVYVVLGILSGLGIYLAAPVLAADVFKIPVEAMALARDAMRLGGLTLALRFVDGVFLSALRGLQRFDLAARVAMTVKVAAQIGAVIAAGAGYGLRAILTWAMVTMALGTLVEVGLVRRLTGGRSLRPVLDLGRLREVWGFGLWSWVQGIAGTLFGQADRLIIGAFLGPSVVAYYAVCLQLAQQIHLLPTVAASFLFPLVSELHERGKAELLGLYLASSRIIMAVAGGVAVALIVCGRPLLEVWLGASFAGQAANILAALSGSYALFAANSIAPFYFMNGSGRVREQAIISLGSGTITTAAAFPLILGFGVVGIAFSRTFDAFSRVFARFYAHRVLFGLRSIMLSLDAFVIVGGTLVIAMGLQPFAMRWFAGSPAGLVKALGTVGAFALVVIASMLGLLTIARAYHARLVFTPVTPARDVIRGDSVEPGALAREDGTGWN